jgi:cold shock protein
MANATIKKLNERGYGFLTNEAGEDIFFHRSSTLDYDGLTEGQAVTYELDPIASGKGPRAGLVSPA